MENLFVNSDIVLDYVEFSKDCKLQRNGIKKQINELTGNITKTVVNLGKINELNKPEGEYITYDIKSEAVNGNVLSNEIYLDLKRLLKCVKKLLIIGVGNDVLISDSLGPKTIALVNIEANNYNKIFKICPNVVGNTGIESDCIIKAVINIVKPNAVVVVDSLASRSFNRVGNSFQISTAGIAPGSGSGKHNSLVLNKETLGVPVVAIGVPMVVHINSFLYDFCSEIGNESMLDIIPLINKKHKLSGVVMAPKEVDYIIDFCSQIIASAINKLIYNLK